MNKKVAVTSYGRNKNHDDEIKKTKRRPIIAPAIAVRLLKIKLSKTDKAGVLKILITIPLTLETMRQLI